MLARIYTLFFIAVVCLGVWVQRDYMRVSEEEFKNEEGLDRSKLELFYVTGVKTEQFKFGKLDATFEIGQASYLNDGQILVSKNFKYKTDGTTDRRKLSLTSSEAVGLVKTFEPGKSLFEAQRRLEDVSFPKLVRIDSDGDSLTTSDVSGNATQKILSSSKAFLISGPNRKMSGTGFSFQYEAGELDVGGPLDIELLPRTFTDSRKSKNERK